MDLDPGGPKTCRSSGSGSGSATLLIVMVLSNPIKSTRTGAAQALVPS